MSRPLRSNLVIPEVYNAREVEFGGRSWAVGRTDNFLRESFPTAGGSSISVNVATTMTTATTTAKTSQPKRAATRRFVAVYGVLAM